VLTAGPSDLVCEASYDERNANSAEPKGLAPVAIVARTEGTLVDPSRKVANEPGPTMGSVRRSRSARLEAGLHLDPARGLRGL
jgi:hypothetical protein